MIGKSSSTRKGSVQRSVSTREAKSFQNHSKTMASSDVTETSSTVDPLENEEANVEDSLVGVSQPSIIFNRHKYG